MGRLRQEVGRWLGSGGWSLGVNGKRRDRAESEGPRYQDIRTRLRISDLLVLRKMGGYKQETDLILTISPRIRGGTVSKAVPWSRSALEAQPILNDLHIVYTGGLL